MTTYTVTPTGAGSALTVAEAWKVEKAGDEFVFKGTFTKTITVPKSASGLTLDGYGAHIKGAVGEGLHIRADYTTVEGFEVSGSTRNGILASDVHHTTIKDVNSHHNTKSGFFGGLVDFLKIEDSDFAFNKGAAGISFHPKAFAGVDAPGYRVEVTGNTVRSNGQTVSTERIGILADNNPEYLYPYSILVAENEVYDNYRVGVYAFNVKMFLRFNDIHGNGTDTAVNPVWRFEFGARDSDVYAAGNEIIAGKSGYAVYLQGDEDHVHDWKLNTIKGGVILRGTGDHDPPPTQAADFLDTTKIGLDHGDAFGVQAPALQFDPFDWG